jgi:hypothetical protein
VASGERAIPADAPSAGWPSDDEPATESNLTSDGLWDWDVEELDYAQDIELEQYARRVLRGEHDD